MEADRNTALFRYLKAKNRESPSDENLEKLFFLRSNKDSARNYPNKRVQVFPSVAAFTFGCHIFGDKCLQETITKISVYIQ